MTASLHALGLGASAGTYYTNDPYREARNREAIRRAAKARAERVRTSREAADPDACRTQCPHQVAAHMTVIERFDFIPEGDQFFAILR